MQKKKYLIEPVHLKRIRSQLEYQLQLQKNIQELQLPTKKEKNGGLFSKIKKLF